MRSNHPRDGHPLRMGVQLTSDGQQLVEGGRKVAVDDDVVEPVAVVVLHPLAAADHVLQLVIGKATRAVLVERRTGVRGAARLLQHVQRRRLYVNHVRLELGRP